MSFKMLEPVRIVKRMMDILGSLLGSSNRSRP